MKKFFLTIFVIICSIFIFSNVCAFECVTEQKLIEKNYNTLINKKYSENTKIYKTKSVSSSQPLFKDGYIMPSTGDVKVLVLPIEFKDKKFGDAIYENLQNTYFSEQDLNVPNLNYSELSLCDYYKKVSHNKLRLSGMILPVYTASENRDYYKTDIILQPGQKPLLSMEVAKAIESYRDIIGDLSQYDSDNDGYIDCLHVFWAGSSGEWGTEWWPKIYSGNFLELYDDISMSQFAGMSEESANDIYAPSHETGHLLGLPDNYEGRSCVIPDGCCELMQGNGYYINALYKYLLDWEEPEILPYENDVQNIELYASDVYNDNVLDKPKSIIFIPDKNSLPYTEFYIIEFRASDKFKDTPGILIWHANIKKSSWQDIIAPSEDCIKPVYKSNENNSYKASDIYTLGDKFSPDTTPSSSFCNGAYTGVYLKVNSLDDEKASVTVGYKDPIYFTPPKISITANKQAVRTNEEVEFKINYENYTDINNEIAHPFTRNLTGSLDRTTISGNIKFGSLRFIAWNGEGMMGFTLEAGSVLNGVIPSRSISSPMVYVDNTPPEITINGESEMVLNVGEEYIEPGAVITDNLDPDIENKLVIDNSSVNTNQAGIYKVTYNASDHAGNKTEAVRTVTVYDPLIEVQYSNTEYTNQDVTVTIIPRDGVTSDMELSHTFTENGIYTFVLKDTEGNIVERPIEVSWIDKKAPVATIKYSTTEPTYENVTATISFDEEDVTITNNYGANKYIFEYNSSYTFRYTDKAGNIGSATAKVTWIDNKGWATIEYSTTELTNEDVTVIIIPPEKARGDISAFGSGVKHIETKTTTDGYVDRITLMFSRNSQTYLRFENPEGKIFTVIPEVKWIDKTPPTAKIEYSTTEPTNQDVTVKLTPSENVTDDTELMHTFTDNGEYTFAITDLAGNTSNITVEVTWIDKSVSIIKYSNTKPTSQDVVATLYPADGLSSDMELSHTFTENGTYAFILKDAEGNIVEEMAEVTWIDKTPPSATIEYSTENPTNDSVTAVITPNEKVSRNLISYSVGIEYNIEQTDGYVDKVTVIFSANGNFNITLRDEAGNSARVRAEVTWIDKTPPSGTVKYSPSGITTGSVTATLTTSEEVKPIEMMHTFTENGSYIFEFEDLAGNKGSAVATVDWIIDATPTPEPTATPTPEPTATPTLEPTATPTLEPTATPTLEPTATPTLEPTSTPTLEPTATPTPEPTSTPTPEPTATPTLEPTATPTLEPISNISISDLYCVTDFCKTDDYVSLNLRNKTASDKIVWLIVAEYDEKGIVRDVSVDMYITFQNLDTPLLKYIQKKGFEQRIFLWETGTLEPIIEAISF